MSPCRDIWQLSLLRVGLHPVSGAPGCCWTSYSAQDSFPRQGTTWPQVQTVKNLPAVKETWVRSLGWEEPLEEGIWQPTSVFLPGESPGQRSLAGCMQSMGLQRVRHDRSNLAHLPSVFLRAVSPPVTESAANGLSLLHTNKKPLSGTMID